MAYLKHIYWLGNSVEVEKVHSGRYGKRGGKNEKKKKPTKEEVQKVNERNAAKKLRRKINVNFTEGDIHSVLTYRKEERPDLKKAKKQIKDFIDNLRREYKKQGRILKYVIVTEYKNKAIHHHMIINDIGNTARLLQKLWKYGRPHNTLLDDTGEYGMLAAYLVKETQKTFRSENNPNKLRYSCSRNLINPEEEPIKKTQVIQAENWIEIPKPIKGYYLDKDSLVSGISEKTGYPYQYYTMKKIKEVKIE